jgi:3D (Asp-Asp-Asp) domain-containing protein
MWSLMNFDKSTRLAIVIVLGITLIIGSLVYSFGNFVKRDTSVPQFAPSPSASPAPFIGPKILPKISIVHKPVPLVPHHALRIHTKIASRSRENFGRYMKITSYCDTGNVMANGEYPYVGVAAIYDRSIPLGTIVITSFGRFVIKDHIGSGSDLDIFTHSCYTASQFGVHHERVYLVSR